MSEYIEREALLEKIEEDEPLNWTGSDAEMQAYSDYWFYRALVEEQPIADVVEVRHGEWEDDGIAYVCNICGKNLVIEQGTAEMNYCPNCGAKMGGETK